VAESKIKKEGVIETTMTEGEEEIETEATDIIIQTEEGAPVEIGLIEIGIITVTVAGIEEGIVVETEVTGIIEIKEMIAQKEADLTMTINRHERKRENNMIKRKTPRDTEQIAITKKMRIKKKRNNYEKRRLKACRNKKLGKCVCMLARNVEQGIHVKTYKDDLLKIL
jgi:hypothetical protein